MITATELKWIQLNAGIDMLEEVCCNKIYCSDLPVNSKFCAFDRSDIIINSNSTMPREQLCAQHF